MGMAKIASKEVFCYGRNFFLAVRSEFNSARLGKQFYARSVRIKFVLEWFSFVRCRHCFTQLLKVKLTDVLGTKRS